MSNKNEHDIDDLLKQVRESMKKAQNSDAEKSDGDGFDQKLAELLEKHVGDGQNDDVGELLDDEPEFSLEELQIMKDGAALLASDDEESDLEEPEIEEEAEVVEPEVEEDPEEEMPPLIKAALEDAFIVGDDVEEIYAPSDDEGNIIEIKEEAEPEVTILPEGADEWLDIEEDEELDEWAELDSVSDIDDIDSLEELEALDEVGKESEVESVETIEADDFVEAGDGNEKIEETFNEFVSDAEVLEEEMKALEDEKISEVFDIEDETDNIEEDIDMLSLDISELTSEDDAEADANDVCEDEFPEPDEMIFEDEDIAQAVGEDAVADGETASYVSDKDVNEAAKLAVSIGFESELEEQFGRDCVRKIKEDILRDEAKEDASERDDGDYTDHSEDAEIKKKYRNRKILEVFRFSGTLIIAILLCIYENTELFGLSLPGLPSAAEQTALYILTAALAFVTATALSTRCLWRGFKSIFTLEPEAHSLTAAVALLNIVYDIVAMIVCHGEAVLFNFPTSLCLTMTALYELLMAFRESRTFDVVSGVGERYMLEEDKGELPQKKRSKRAKTYSVRRGDFTDGYFRRTNAASRGIYLLNYMIVPLVAISLVMTIITASLSASAVMALSAFLSSFLICMPSAILVVLSLPGAIAAVRLGREGCAIVGEAGENEYARDKLIVFDDVTIFPSKNIKTNGIKLYEGFEIYDVLVKTAALFSALGGPLSEIFDSDDIGSAISEKYHKEAEVRLIRCTRGGVEAVIDGETNILAGNSDFLGQYGISLPSNARDEQLKAAGEVTVIYIAIDRRAAARLYVDYRVDERFENALSLLEGTRTRLAIRTADPAICDELLEKKRGPGKCEISIIRAEPRSCEVAEYLDSGIVARGEARDILLPLAAASKLKKLRRQGLGISFGVFLFNIIITLLLTVTGMLKYASSLSVALYMIIMSLPTVLVGLGALKIGKLPNKKDK